MTSRKILVCAVLASVAFGLLAGTACKGKSEEKSIVKERIDDTLEKATGGKVNLDLKSGTIKIQTPEGEKTLATAERKWPEDLPEGMIKFEGGQVMGVNRSSTEAGKVWTVHFMDVADGALGKYADKLRAAGWTIVSSTPGGVGGTLQAYKGDIQVSVMIEEAMRSGFVSFLQQAGK